MFGYQKFRQIPQAVRCVRQMLVYAVTTTVCLTVTGSLRATGPESLITSDIPASLGSEIETLYLGIVRSDGSIDYLDAGLARLESHILSTVSELEGKRKWFDILNGTEHRYTVDELIGGVIPQDLMPLALRNKGLFVEHLLEPTGKTSPETLKTLRNTCQSNEDRQQALITDLLTYLPFLCSEGDLSFRHYHRLYTTAYDLPLFQSMRRELLKASDDRRAARLFRAGTHELRAAALTLTPFVALRRLAKMRRGVQLFNNLNIFGNRMPRQLRRLLKLWVIPSAGVYAFHSSAAFGSHWLKDHILRASYDGDISAEEWLAMRQNMMLHGINGKARHASNAKVLELLTQSEVFTEIGRFFQEPLISSYMMEPVHRFNLKELEDTTWAYDSQLLWDLKGGAPDAFNQQVLHGLLNTPNTAIKETIAQWIMESDLLAELFVLATASRSMEPLSITFVPEHSIHTGDPLHPVLALPAEPEPGFATLIKLIEGLWHQLKPSGPMANIAEYRTFNAFLQSETAEQVLLTFLAMRVLDQLEQPTFGGSVWSDLRNLDFDQLLERRHLTFIRTSLPVRADRLRFGYILKTLEVHRADMYAFFQQGRRWTP